MSSQETAPTSSQNSSQWASQDMASMPSQDSTTNATALGATGGTLMEDKEACLEGPTLKCTPAEERVLLGPSLNQVLAVLNKAPLGYLMVLAKCIEQIKSTKASQMPTALLRAPLRLPAPPAGTESQLDLLTMTTAATVTLSEAIYSATSNLGPTVLSLQKRTPT